MQDHPGAPGAARPGNTGTAVPAACGGAAVQSPAPGHSRPRATPMPMPMPKAPDHTRSSAAPLPKAPGHDGPRATSMAFARPHSLWPGERRPECAADHRPLAGSREPATPGSLAPRPCHSPRSHLPAIPLHYLSGACCHAGTDPPAACHRGHGLPTPTPLARSAPGSTLPLLRPLGRVAGR